MMDDKFFNKEELRDKVVGIEYSNKYSVVKNIDGGYHLVNKSLIKWYDELREEGFIFLRNNYLANTKYIKKFFGRESNKKYASMADGSIIVIPKGKYKMILHEYNLFADCNN